MHHAKRGVKFILGGILEQYPLFFHVTKNKKKSIPSNGGD
jgi:hypothetical protein